MCPARDFGQYTRYTLPPRRPEMGLHLEEKKTPATPLDALEIGFNLSVTTDTHSPPAAPLSSKSSIRRSGEGHRASLRPLVASPLRLHPCGYQLLKGYGTPMVRKHK